MPSPSVLVLDDAAHVAALAAELVANRARARAHLRLLMPTGRTPVGMYAALRAMARDGALDLRHVTVLGLDEYDGLAREDPQSFRATLDRELAGIPLGGRDHPDGAAADLDVEAARYQAVLDAAPVDLAVLGIGRDAHVAFDEPGSTAESPARVVTLAPSTVNAAAEAFGGADRVPRTAITTGLRTLRAAREVLVLATGAAKAEALRAMLDGPVGPEVPASLLRAHPCLTVLCDRAAAAHLPADPGRDADHVAVVLGHREPGVSREHRISAHSRERLRRAARLGRTTPLRAVVLTGYTHTGGLSEAEQMGREWPAHEVPLLLEVAGRSTAENASRSLPLILAIGGVRRVSVVTSAWHVRARYFFAPYEDYGLTVDHRPARPLRGWTHLLAEEIGGMPGMAGQRRAAMAAVRVPEVAGT